jgi:outer membrane protein OmpA-like peptidoglycan-associated protein
MAQPVTGPYVSLGGGGSLQQNEIALPSPLIGRLHDNNWKFDAGVEGEVSAGYGLGNGFRFEVEGDILSNHVREYSAITPRRAGGYETKVGGMANMLFDLDVRLPITPYIGLGAGGQVVTQHDFNQGLPEVRLPGDGGSESVGAFAYQGIAGASLPVAWIAGLSFTAEYRFLGLLDPIPAFLRQTFIPHAVSNVHFTNNYTHSVMLGVRYALFAPAPAPAPAPEAAPAAPAPEAARTYLVFFDWDRSDLTGRARQIVAEAAQASTRVRTTRIEVNGYTDLSGTAAYNQHLSVRRAQSVEAELIRDGVAPGEIAIHGFGERDPLVPTGAGVREPQNRRVEIILR